MDAQTHNYLRYYSSQSGGALDPFQGARRGQYGNGLGDILKGIFRTVLPIAAHGASTFLGEMVKQKASGDSWKNSAINAMSPTAHQVVDKVHEKFRKRKQLGGGKRRKRKLKRTGVGRRSGRKPYKRFKRRNYKKNAASHRIKFLNF